MDDFILNNTMSDDDLSILSFIEKVQNGESISFTTSGTTGEPKLVTHSADTLTKNIKIKLDQQGSVWGLTYDYRKIAGSQVILQAYLNKGKIVKLFNKTTNEIVDLIERCSITHLSATPTFYRLLITNNTFNHVKQVTLGGESVDENLICKIKRAFPNAKVTNIYALTEFGTLFSSDTYYFELSEKNNSFIQIRDNRIFVKEYTNWIDTGDIVELLDSNKFKIIGRDTNMINVGGIKVNPIQVENVINELDYVTGCYVYSKENSIMGNVVAVDIQLAADVPISTIKNDLRQRLSVYEMPLRINLVPHLELNSTGKIIRKCK
jgi:acyl-coenzyme A synthetase/AMP-(fatty) acid ligase